MIFFSGRKSEQGHSCRDDETSRMEETEMRTCTEVIREMGLPKPRVRYWVSANLIPEPFKVGIQNFWSDEQIAEVHAFAASHRLYERRPRAEEA